MFRTLRCFTTLPPPLHPQPTLHLPTQSRAAGPAWRLELRSWEPRLRTVLNLASAGSSRHIVSAEHDGMHGPEQWTIASHSRGTWNSPEVSIVVNHWEGWVAAATRTICSVPIQISPAFFIFRSSTMSVDGHS